MGSFRILFGFASLLWVDAQAPDAPDRCSHPQACTADLLNCSTRRSPYYWHRMWELAQCQLPMEIRIGLTVSMTGSRSHEQTTSDILSTLRELQSLRGNLNEADTGVPFQFCLQFCLMDDESLPWKAVEHYRVFANFSSFDESMDMLLGPATYDFRAAVAQVSDENRWPLLLWSMFPDLGLNPVVAQQTTVSATASWIRALLAAPPPKILKTLFGALPENMSAPNTCETFTAPENYTLRPLAKLLPCDGPCQAGRDLDYCAVEAQTLAVTGNWSPADALRHGGWRDGCLNGSALANVATFMDLTLFFERTAAPVVVYMSGDAGTLKIGPQVFVASPGAMWLRTGTSVTFEAADEDPSGFSICLRQSCDFFQCQAPYSPLPPGSFCNGLFCGAEDFEHCCTLERQSAVNGPIWANSFHSLLDMSVPPTRWLQDALPRLLHPRTQLMVCVSQDLFRDLCRAHVEQAVEIGFRTTSMLSVTEEGASLQQAIVQLQLMRPAPSLVLVCGDMGIYSRFIHGLIANSQTFYWVMSCFPFGRELQGSVKGSQLAYNFLEPMPWPPLQQIEAVDQAMAEIQEAIAQTIPGLSLASLTSQQPNLNMQMLALRAAVQMLYQAVYKGMTSWFLYQTSTVGVLQPDGANTSLQDGGIDYLVTALKTPLKISSFTHDTYFTYFGQRNFDQQGHVIASRYETGLRQFIPLANISEISKRDPVKIKGSWRYNHARHLFSSFREFSFDETLEPNRLDFLSNKLIYTYPCPAGCVVVGLDCSACPPGFFRQASGVGCAPCPANASVFYNFWAGPQCFPCPHGSRCDRPDEAPVALPGYLLLADPAAKTHQAVLGMDACSTAPGGGLADIHAKDVDRWYELKAQTFWIVEECFPQTACAGQNQCAQFHYGDKCSICSPGSSKFEGYFCRVDCAECPQVAALVFQTLVLAAFQVISILLLSLAIRDSAWNVHSISGPVVIALLRALLIHAVLSKMALEPLTTFEIQELHVLLWFSTLSQAAFSPCTLPLIGCLRPLESLEDLNIYLLFALASFASTTLLACLISVCTSSRRWDALIRTAYAALQITVPSLSFYSLYLMQCDGTQLYKQRDMACPDLVNLGNGYVLFHIIVMFLQWLSFPYIIKNAVYVQVQERYGIAVQKMLVGRRYWKVLDDIILSTVTLAATSLREEGILYAVLSIQTAYAILIENLQPYSYLGGNGIVNTNRSLATSLACLCAWLLFEDFVLSYIGSLFDVSLRTVQLVTKSIALSLGLLHIWVIFLLTALESRVGLVLNMNSRPSSRFTLRLSRLTRCFASSYSMLVQRKSGGQLVFDARHIPKRFRMVFMQGVASAVNFILHRNSILRIVDVRNMVSLAVEKILEARHINLMFGLNAAYARSLSKGEVDEPDEAFAAILGSELIAAYELVSAIEDMCSGYFSSPGRKEKDRAASDPLDDADEDLISKMEKEGFGTQGTMPLATPKKATVFALRRQTAKDRFDKRLFEKAQADCLKAVESILPKVEQLQRQLTEMWLVSDNDHDRLVPAFIDKVESLCSLLKEVKGFFNDERDDQEMEHFLSILHTQLRALDTDISQDLASKAKASKAKQRRSSLRGLDAESLSILGSREDAALLEACEDPPIKPDIKDVNANQPSRPSAFLSFNHLDFRNPLQPAPSCAPALDRVFEE